MSSPRSSRPEPPRRFSSHLRQHRPRRERTNGASSTTGANYGALTPTSSARVTFRSNSETERLLEAQHDDEEHADSDGLYPPHCCWTAEERHPPPRSDPFSNSKCPVYANIHMIRREIISSIDDPYSIDQLKAPRMNISVVRPLVEQFYSSDDLSIVYCLLVNRTQFIRQQSYATHHQTVNLTRALLCELVAEKVLRRYNEHNPGPKGLLKLANILVAGFEPFQNAPDDVMKDNFHFIHYMQRKNGQWERRLTALEIAIVSESKSFLASSACQKVVDAIYRGKIVYTPNSFVDVLPDYWKRRPISLYDPRRGPTLNQYRLVVPRTRNFIEIIQFMILLALYLVVMENRESRLTTTFTFIEGIFDVYALGWILDQLASMLEHGWEVYTQNLWSFLDVTFSGIFMFYFVIRMHSLRVTDADENLKYARLSLDALSCAAPVLIPRLAFNLMSENIVFLCLRSMLADFFYLVVLAIWCFIGFLLSLKWLHNGIHEPVTIGKWMIWIWFGLDGTGIQKSPDFHWLLGPAITIAFAFLGNTLFVTILVSMLSTTFSTISANATQEMQFRRAVLTFEGVKADAIFAYMPPFNLFALLVMLPLKFAINPRWFHKINVTTVKIINMPLLAAIAWYERKYLWLSRRAQRFRPRRIDWQHPNGPRAEDVTWWMKVFQLWDLSRFRVHRDLEAVFDESPSTPTEGAVDDFVNSKYEGIGQTLQSNFLKQFSSTNWKNRSLSVVPDAEDLKSSKTSSSGPGALADTLVEESEHDGDDEADAPPGFKKITSRRERMDSLVDFGENSLVSHEANARLHHLEDSVARIESLLLQLLNSDEPTATEADVEEDIAREEENEE